MDTKILLDICNSTNMPTSSPATVDDLGLQGCLYLWAMSTSQERRLPIAPTRRMTLKVMELLREQGVIAVPWPMAAWEAHPSAKQTPIEGLQWDLAWTVYEPLQLTLALEDYLVAVARDDLGMSLRWGLWMDLAAAEAECFYEQQLVKHHLPGDWSADLAFVHRERDLSIAQWRYCAWAAVRRGASLALQFGPQQDAIRDAIFSELRRRASSVASGQWSRGALLPYQTTPGSALARGFVKLLAPLGINYWSVSPSLEGLAMAFPSKPDPHQSI